MSICRNYTKIAYAVTGPKKAILTRLACGMWSCDHCAVKNANSWRYWLIKRIPEIASDWYLVTLTASEKTRTMLGSFNNLRNNLDALIKRIRRVFGLPIEYVRVYERHPTSEAIHVHMIMHGLTPFVAYGYSVKHQAMTIGVMTRPMRNGYATVKTWFKDTCKDLGMGYIADVQLIKGEPLKAVWYVTKYLTKAQQDLHIPYLRHVQVTEGIGAIQYEAQYKWIPASYITTYTFDAPNTEVTDLDTGFVIDNNYWEVKGYYPADD